MCIGTPDEVALFNTAKAAIVANMNSGESENLKADLNATIGLNLNMSQMVREVASEFDRAEEDVASLFVSALDDMGWNHTEAEHAIHATA